MYLEENALPELMDIEVESSETYLLKLGKF